MGKVPYCSGVSYSLKGKQIEDKPTFPETWVRACPLLWTAETFFQKKIVCLSDYRIIFK